MNDLRTRLHTRDGAISVIVDRPDLEEIGTAMLVPAYGLTAEDMFLPAHFMACNGIRVVRFDLRNHVGESSGEIYDFRLSSVVEDLRAVQGWAGRCGVVAVSLSARPAIRMARMSPPDWVLLVTPVIDVAFTLSEVVGLPLLGWELDAVPENLEVLGFRVGRGFIADCRENGFRDWRDAADDFEKITSPAVVIYGEGDPWVRAVDVIEVVRARAERGGTVRQKAVATSCHQLSQNPVIAQRFFAEATREAVELAGGDPSKVVIPRFTEVVAAYQDAFCTRSAHRRDTPRIPPADTAP